MIKNKKINKKIYEDKKMYDDKKVYGDKKKS